VKSKGIGKERFIAAIKIATRDSRGIEGKAHVGKTGSDELSVDSRVVGKRGAEQSLIIIKLIGESMLEFEAFDRCSKEPKGWGVF
jgi:hypothetical protein